MGSLSLVVEAKVLTKACRALPDLVAAHSWTSPPTPLASLSPCSRSFSSLNSISPQRLTLLLPLPKASLFQIMAWCLSSLHSHLCSLGISHRNLFKPPI